LKNGAEYHRYRKISYLFASIATTRKKNKVSA